MTLDPADAALLDFEACRWLHLGVKEEAIVTKLGLSVHRYHQHLHALLDDPAALEHAPMLVLRLRRLRDTRRRAWAS